MSEQTPGSTVTVTDNPAASRFEARVDGELAGFIDYDLRDHRPNTSSAPIPSIAFLHTETLPEFGGRGVAAALTAQALSRVRAERGTGSLQPYCPYTQRYLSEHPDQQDLVVADWRRR